MACRQSATSLSEGKLSALQAPQAGWDETVLVAWVARGVEVLAKGPRKNYQYGISRWAAGLGYACPLLLFQGRTAYADQSDGQSSCAGDRRKLRCSRDD